MTEILEQRMLLTTMTVNTTLDVVDPDDNLLSLREAIEAANATPNQTDTLDRIEFNIPRSDLELGQGSPGALLIEPHSPLPAITDPVVIDGYTQPGAAANSNVMGQPSNARIRIELGGAQAGPEADGVVLAAGSDGSEIRGLGIFGFDRHGVVIRSDDNTLAGNVIGTNAVRATELGNGGHGVRIAAGSFNTVGGIDPADQNVITGNGGDGVAIVNPAVRWTGQGDGSSWHDADNWRDAAGQSRAPRDGDVVLIPDLPETDEVVFSEEVAGPGVSLSGLEAAEPVRITADTLTLQPDGSFSFHAGLTMTGGTLENQGLINLLHVVATDARINNVGEIRNADLTITGGTVRNEGRITGLGILANNAQVSNSGLIGNFGLTIGTTGEMAGGEIDIEHTGVIGGLNMQVSAEHSATLRISGRVGNTNINNLGDLGVSNDGIMGNTNINSGGGGANVVNDSLMNNTRNIVNIPNDGTVNVLNFVNHGTMNNTNVNTGLEGGSELVNYGFMNNTNVNAGGEGAHASLTNYGEMANFGWNLGKGGTGDLLNEGAIKNLDLNAFGGQISVTTAEMGTIESAHLKNQLGTMNVLNNGTMSSVTGVTGPEDGTEPEAGASTNTDIVNNGTMSWRQAVTRNLATTNIVNNGTWLFNGENPIEDSVFNVTDGGTVNLLNHGFWQVSGTAGFNVAGAGASLDITNQGAWEWASAGDLVAGKDATVNIDNLFGAVARTGPGKWIAEEGTLNFWGGDDENLSLSNIAGTINVLNNGAMDLAELYNELGSTNIVNNGSLTWGQAVTRNLATTNIVNNGSWLFNGVNPDEDSVFNVTGGGTVNLLNNGDWQVSGTAGFHVAGAGASLDITNQGAWEWASAGDLVAGKDATVNIDNLFGAVARTGSGKWIADEGTLNFWGGDDENLSLSNIAGTINVLNNGAMDLAELHNELGSTAIVNNGTLTWAAGVTGDFATTNVVNQGTLEFSNDDPNANDFLTWTGVGGTLEIENNGEWRVSGTAGIRVTGAGATMNVTNAGTLEWSSAGDWTADGGTVHFDTRLGAVAWNGPGQLSVDAGVIDATLGNVDLAEGTSWTITRLSLTGDEARLAGIADVTVSGDVVNAGTIALRSLTVGGNYETRIAGDPVEPGIDFGQLRIAGDATLKGVLRVAVDPSYLPGAGHVYPVIVGDGQLAGNFDSFEQRNVPPTIELILEQTATGYQVVTAGVTPAGRTVMWTGQGDATSWHDPDNWLDLDGNAGVPSDGDNRGAVGLLNVQAENAEILNAGVVDHANLNLQGSASLTNNGSMNKTELVLTDGAELTNTGFMNNTTLRVRDGGAGLSNLGGMANLVVDMIGGAIDTSSGAVGNFNVKATDAEIYNGLVGGLTLDMTRGLYLNQGDEGNITGRVVAGRYVNNGSMGNTHLIISGESGRFENNGSMNNTELLLSDGAVVTNAGSMNNSFLALSDGAGLTNAGVMNNLDVTLNDGAVLANVGTVGNLDLEVLDGHFENTQGRVCNLDLTLEEGQVLLGGVVGDPPTPAIGAVGELVLNGGTLNAAVDFTVANLTWAAGTLSGQGATEVTDRLQIGGGDASERVLERTLISASPLMQEQGTTTLAGGVLDTDVSILGGTLAGSGSITGDLTDGSDADDAGPAVVAPERISVGGDYRQREGAALRIGISGEPIEPGADFGQLAVAGDVTLAGNLEVVVDPAFTPVEGQVYPVIPDAATVEGAFGNVTLINLPQTLSIEPLGTATTLELLVSSAATFEASGVFRGAALAGAAPAEGEPAELEVPPVSEIDDWQATGNAILGNAIFANGGLGIDLGDDGVTENDAGDADTGPNGLQNVPLLNSAQVRSDHLIVTGALESEPDTRYLIELFDSGSPGGADHSQTPRLIGRVRVETESDDPLARFTAVLPGSAAEASHIVGTATNRQTGSTSEFSTAIDVSQVLPTVSIDDVEVVEGDAGTTFAAFTVTLSEPSDQQVTVQYSTVAGTADADVDFVPQSDTLIFEPTQTRKSIMVPVLGDEHYEPDETFTVELSQPTGAVLADRSLVTVRTATPVTASLTGLNSGLISADGGTIVVSSSANLTGDNPDGNFEVFLYDVQTAALTQVTDSSGQSPLSGTAAGTISADGTRFVGLASESGFLLPTSSVELFWFDTVTGTRKTILTTVTGAQALEGLELSGDGRHVLLSGMIDPLGTNPDLNEDVFLYDAVAETFEQITDTVSGLAYDVTNEGAGLTHDGSLVVVESDADLSGEGLQEGSGELESISRVYLYETANGAFTLVSGAEPAGSGNEGDDAAISADGSTIVFTSRHDLVGGSSDFVGQIFRYDVASGDLVQVTDNAEGGSVFDLALSADGSTVVFESNADLTGSNSDRNTEIFYLDSDSSPPLRQVTDTSDEVDNGLPSVSGDGRFVTFTSDGNFTGENPDESREVMLYDTLGDAFAQVTHTTRGLSALATVSDDGTCVAFLSSSDLAGENPDGGLEVFLYSGTTGQVTQISNGPGELSSLAPVISDDGSTIAFLSKADLTGTGLNADGNYEVFAYVVDQERMIQVTQTTGVESAAFLAAGSVRDYESFMRFPPLLDISGRQRDYVCARRRA